LVNIGSAVAGLLGSGIIGKPQGSDTALAVSEIAKLLNSVSFDSIKLQIERAPDLSFKLTSLEVLSPILRMTGTGSIASKGTEDIQNAPMNIVLQLGAKNELGFLLQRVNMLGATKDEKGYQIMSRTFNIGGTASKPSDGCNASAPAVGDAPAVAGWWVSAPAVGDAPDVAGSSVSAPASCDTATSWLQATRTTTTADNRTRATMHQQ
jgi:hypothetical protein